MLTKSENAGLSHGAEADPIGRSIEKLAGVSGPPEVSLFLGDGMAPWELYGDHPYHNVVCMVVYVCRTTGNFHLRFADKLGELDRRYGGIEIFMPSCAPDIPHVVYMVQYLKKVNPGAEVLFGTDDLSSLEWARMARFSLFVITSSWEGRVLGKDGYIGGAETIIAWNDVGALKKRLVETEKELQAEREKVMRMTSSVTTDSPVVDVPADPPAVSTVNPTTVSTADESPVIGEGKVPEPVTVKEEDAQPDMSKPDITLEAEPVKPATKSRTTKPRARKPRKAAEPIVAEAPNLEAKALDPQTFKDQTPVSEEGSALPAAVEPAKKRRPARSRAATTTELSTDPPAEEKKTGRRKTPAKPKAPAPRKRTTNKPKEEEAELEVPKPSDEGAMTPLRLFKKALPASEDVLLSVWEDDLKQSEEPAVKLAEEPSEQAPLTLLGMLKTEVPLLPVLASDHEDETDPE